MNSEINRIENKGEIIIYQNKDNNVSVNVRLEDENVWLTQQQMAELFQSSRTNIVEHIKHIYEEGELSENATCRKFRQVQIEGNRNVERELPFYNLDLIISLGYRIKSHIATQFRIWATQRLKEYIIKGFTMDDDGKTKVSLMTRDGNIWLNQSQLAELFDTSKQNVSLHIINILNESELDANSVVKDYLTTAADGKNYNITFYSLDLILAVGFRVRSKRGTQFRQWANRNLKEYMIKGFVMDDERLKQGKTAFGTRHCKFVVFNRHCGLDPQSPVILKQVA